MRGARILLNLCRRKAFDCRFRYLQYNRQHGGGSSAVSSYVHILDCVDECGPSAVPRRVVTVLPTLGTVSSRLIQ